MLSSLGLSRHNQLSDKDRMIGDPTSQKLKKFDEDQKKLQELGINAIFTAVATFLY